MLPESKLDPVEAPWRTWRWDDDIVPLIGLDVAIQRHVTYHGRQWDEKDGEEYNMFGNLSKPSQQLCTCICRM